MKTPINKLAAAGLASVIRQTMTDARTDARTPRVWSDDPIATIWAIGYAIGVDMTVDSRDPIYRVGAVQGMGARGQCCHGAPCQFDDMASAIAHATNK